MKPTENTITLELSECVAEVLKFGHIDLFVFSDPLYFLSHDEQTSIMFNKYEKAFITFDHCNN